MTSMKKSFVTVAAALWALPAFHGAALAEPMADTDVSGTSSTTSTTTTVTPTVQPPPAVPPATNVTTTNTSKKTTGATEIEVTTPPSPEAGATTRVEVTPSEAPNSTTNIEVNTPPPAVNVTELPPPNPAPVVPIAPVPAAVDPALPAASERRPVPRLGTALTVGGGFVDFTGDDARDVTNSGGYWNARIISGTRQFLGAEAAYIGSARDVNALGLSNNAMLVSNGVEGALRLNIPVIRGRSIVEPFAFAGLGWSRYNIARTNMNTSSLAGSDDVLEIPYGGGLSLGHNGFLVDARFTYRSTYYNDLMRTPTGSYGRLDNWSLGGQLGVEF
jgi:hypothetical protein